MPLDFPDTPTVGDDYTAPEGGRTWTWDGLAWLLAPNAASVNEVDEHRAEVPAHQAAQIGYTNLPSGLTATDTQAAIDELAADLAAGGGGGGVSQAYVDAADALRLPLAGGTMTGAINMGTKAITNIAAAVGIDDAVRRRESEAYTEAYVDNELGTHAANPDAHDASTISFVPTGTIAATTVQAAIVEVATEAAAGPATTQTGTTYSLTAANNNTSVIMSNAALVSVTVPTNATTALAVGYRALIVAAGAGGVTLVTTGITLIGSAPKVKVAQNQGLYVEKTATDTWIVLGGTL